MIIVNVKRNLFEMIECEKKSCLYTFWQFYTFNIFNVFESSDYIIVIPLIFEGKKFREFHKFLLLHENIICGRYIKHSHRSLWLYSKPTTALIHENIFRKCSSKITCYTIRIVSFVYVSFVHPPVTWAGRIIQVLGTCALAHLSQLSTHYWIW